MARHTHLQRRGARYWARIRIPQDLIEYFDGKQEYVRPLGTSESTVAKGRVVYLNQRAFRTFALIRNIMLSDDMRRKIARQFYEESLRKDELLRLNSRRSAEGAEILELDLGG